MDRENPLLQTDFMRAPLRQPSAPAPAQTPGPQEGAREQRNPLMQTEFMAGKPATPATPAQSSPAVDRAVQLTTGRPPAQDMGWMDVGSQAIRNVPGSAVEFGKSIVQPFLQPVETAQTIGELGKGLYSKGRGLLGYERNLESERVADAVGQFFKERYGDMPSIKRTLAEDPVGAAADLSTVLTGGGALAARAPGALGKVGEVTRAVGTAVDPLSIATKAPGIAARGVATVANIPLSLQSGASFNSLQQATKAGATANPVFWEHLSGSVPPQDLINRVNAGISTVAKQRSDEYMAGMGRIASNQSLPFDKVDEALKAARNVAYHRGSVVNPEAAAVLQNMEDLVRQWRTNPQMVHNIEDFDKLKQALRSTGYASTFKNSPARKIVDDIANAAKNTIPDKRYVQIMENYQAATRELADLTKELTVRGGSSLSQIRKILKSQDTKAKGDLIKRLEQIDPQLPYAIAGVELNPLIPQGLRGQIAGMLSTGAIGGLATLVHPAALAGAAFTLPRVAGTTAYGIGRAGALPENLRAAAPAAGPALFQAGRAEEVAGQAAGGRIQRASGGRISPEAMADRIIGQIERARKNLQAQTGTLLNHDDETIVKALKVANERI